MIGRMPSSASKKNERGESEKRSKSYWLTNKEKNKRKKRRSTELRIHVLYDGGRNARLLDPIP